MKLKKKYLAALVALLLVMTAVVSSIIVSSVQGSRIAYVAVSADKESYSLGENVTFKLRPLSQGVDFTIGGGYVDPNTGIGYGEMVTIIRIPDGMDLHSIIDDPDVLNDMYSWRNHNSINLPIPAFSSSGESLSMSWNGTIKAYDRNYTGYVWGQATAGYYLLYPDHFYSTFSSDRVIKFFLDHSSIFYYDGLDVDYNFTTEGQRTNLIMNLTLPSDFTPSSGSPLEGYLSAFIPTGGPMNASSFFNQTLDLRPGETTTISIALPSAYRSSLTLDAILTTGSGRFIFGFYTSLYHDGQGEVTYVLHQY